VGVIKHIFVAMFKINAQHSTLINSDRTLNELEMVITPLGTLQLIETNSVDDIIVGIGRNIYFPPNTGKLTIFYPFLPILIYIKFISDIKLLMDSLLRLLQTDALSDSMISMLNPGNHSDDQQVVTDRQHRVRPSSDYNVLLTVVNPEPEKLHVDWKPEIPLNR